MAGDGVIMTNFEMTRMILIRGGRTKSKRFGDLVWKNYNAREWDDIDLSWYDNCEGFWGREFKGDQF